MQKYYKHAQRAYKGHCLNLPQDISELATTLPHYPKDLPVVIFKMKGKENSTRDVTVRRQKVLNALLYLIQYNPHYQDVVINENALMCLPENSVPNDLAFLETLKSNTEIDVDTGPQSSEEDNSCGHTWRSNTVVSP